MRPVARFRLVKAALVRVRVWELAPTCRYVGRYPVHAQRGANVLRVRRRVAGELLQPGIYRFIGRTHARRVVDVRVRLVDTGRSLLAVRRGHFTSSCGRPTVAGTAFGLLPPSFGVGPSAPSAAGGGGHTSTPGVPFLPPGNASAPPVHSPRVIGAGPPVHHGRLFLIVLLALATALLATGAVPSRLAAAGGLGAVVVRRRALATVGGVAILALAALLLLLG